MTDENFLNIDDEGGDLYLKLAEDLIAQEKYDDACRNLLYCIDSDTVVREMAYPLIVDLLADGHCIDMITHGTFVWLCCACYIEPEKKKAMYSGIVFGTEKLDKIASVLELYINDFGGDENVGAFYDRLEDLTYDQMPDVDFYDYYYYEVTHDALCKAVENGLSLSGLSDNRLISIYFHTESEDVMFEILKFIYESDKRELLKKREVFGLVKDDNEIIKNAIIRLFDYYIGEENYEIVAWIYNDLTCFDNSECIFEDYIEVSEKIHSRVFEFVLSSKDVKTVSTFFENASNASYFWAEYELLKKLCDFIINNYIDENGAVRKEWQRVPDLIEGMFTVFVDDVFFVAVGNSELEKVYDGYDKRAMKLVFEECRSLFDELFDDEENFDDHFVECDDGVYFMSFEDYFVPVKDKEMFLPKVKETLNIIKEKYFDEL